MPYRILRSWAWLESESHWLPSFLFLAFLGLAFSSSALANAQGQVDAGTLGQRLEKWQVDGKWVELFVNPEARLTISSHCLNRPRRKRCKATRALQEARRIVLSNAALAGGKNPGSVLCLKTGGEVVFSQDAKGQRTFCRYSDQSVIGTGTLRAGRLSEKRP